MVEVSCDLGRNYAQHPLKVSAMFKKTEHSRVIMSIKFPLAGALQECSGEEKMCGGGFA
ncbi:MAG: hypothetical protein ACI9GK_000357 [Devosia sp.]